MSVRSLALPHVQSKLPHVGTTIFTVMSKPTHEPGARNFGIVHITQPCLVTSAASCPNTRSYSS